MSKPLAVTNVGDSQTRSTKTDGIVIPNTLQEEIFRTVGEEHPILNDVFNFDVPGELSLLIEKSEEKQNKDLWTDETDEKKKKKIGELEKLTLGACELPKGITITWKLKKMSIDKFINYIIKKLSEKIGDSLAYGFINGKGKPGVDDVHKPQPLGIITAINSEKDKPQVVTYSKDDNLEPLIRRTISKVSGKFAKGACIYANHDYIWNVLMDIKDKTGRAYFKTDYSTGGIGTIFGAIVKEEEAVPNDTMIFGNVNKCYAYNVNETISIEQEDNKKKRTTYYGAYMLCDGAPKTTKGFAILKKA